MRLYKSFFSKHRTYLIVCNALALLAIYFIVNKLSPGLWQDFFVNLAAGIITIIISLGALELVFFMENKGVEKYAREQFILRLRFRLFAIKLLIAKIAGMKTGDVPLENEIAGVYLEHLSRDVDEYLKNEDLSYDGNISDDIVLQYGRNVESCSKYLRENYALFQDVLTRSERDAVLKFMLEIESYSETADFVRALTGKMKYFAYGKIPHFLLENIKTLEKRIEL